MLCIIHREQGPPESLSTPLRAQSLPEGTAAETRKPTTSIPSVNMTSNALQQTERTVISSANVEVRQTQSINSYAYTSKNQPDQPNISARSASSSSRMNSSIINMSGQSNCGGEHFGYSYIFINFDVQSLMAYCILSLENQASDVHECMPLEKVIFLTQETTTCRLRNLEEGS